MMNIVYTKSCVCFGTGQFYNFITLKIINIIHIHVLVKPGTGRFTDIYQG